MKTIFWYLLALFYAVSVVLAACFIPNHTFSGTLGDTFGGLLSPLIGGITIYFVLRSYNKQLETHELELNNTSYNVLKEALDINESKHSDFLRNQLAHVFEIIYERYSIRDSNYINIPENPENSTDESPFISDPFTFARRLQSMPQDPSPESVVYFYHRHRGTIDQFIQIMTHFNTLTSNFATSKLLPIQSVIIQSKIDEFRSFQVFEVVSREVVDSSSWRDRITSDFNISSYNRLFFDGLPFVNTETHLQEFLDREQRMRNLF